MYVYITHQSGNNSCPLRLKLGTPTKEVQMNKNKREKYS